MLIKEMNERDDEVRCVMHDSNECRAPKMTRMLRYIESNLITFYSTFHNFFWLTLFIV